MSDFTAMIDPEVSSGNLGPCKVMDSHIIKKAAECHQGDLALAIAHEFVPNGCDHALLRCAALHKAGRDLVAKVEQQYAYYTGDDPGAKFNFPLFVGYTNSALPLKAAYHLFDITGGGSAGEEVVGGSEYGQGINVCALAFSNDVHLEVYAFDVLTREGTVTMFKVMEKSSLVPDPAENYHSALTVRFWYVNGEILWLNEEGSEEDASEEDQKTMKIFLQQTMHGVKRASGARDPRATPIRVDYIIREHLVHQAEMSANKSGVLMFVTGNSWAEHPPMKAQHVGDGKHDILCRCTGGHDRAEPEFTSLAQALVKEWCPLSMPTRKLPSGETVCYDRDITIMGSPIDKLAERNRWTDWVIKEVEGGIGIDSKDPRYTKVVPIDLGEGKGSAMLRMTLHPTARDGDHKMTQAAYKARAHQEAPDGIVKAEGGVVLYLGRIFGGHNQLLTGDLCNNLGTSMVTQIKDYQMLQMTGHAAYGLPDFVCELGKSLGLDPDVHGHFCEQDREKFDEIVRGGVDTLYTLGSNQGLKPEGRTDVFVKLWGHDIIWTLEFNAMLTSTKRHILNHGVCHRLITEVRRNQLLFALEQDPSLSTAMDTVNSHGYSPLTYPGLRGTGAGKAAAAPTPVPRNLAAPLALANRQGRQLSSSRTDEQRLAHKQQDAAATIVRGEEANKAVHDKMTGYALKYLGLTTRDELEAGPSADTDWEPGSAAYHLRALLRHEDGFAELKDLNNKAKGSVIRWSHFALHQVSKALEKVVAPRTLAQSDKLLEFFFEAARSQLSASGQNDKSPGRKVDAFKRAREAAQGSAGSSDDTAAAAGGTVEIDDDDVGNQDVQIAKRSRRTPSRQHAYEDRGSSADEGDDEE
tara:strand:- start:792 stop:3377 length:2586 start_codon:yes stop_codon:yes gene_type:complete